MTVKEFVVKLASTLGASVKRIGGLIANAKLSSLLKFGVVIGASVATLIAVIRYFKMKHHVYTDESNKSVVDRALQQNYADLRNQKELDPLMKRVKKNLKKDLKPRTKAKMKKKVQKHKSEYEKFLDEMECKNEYEDYSVDLTDYLDDDEALRYHIGREYEAFRRQMADEDERRRKYRVHTPGTLRSVWDNC